MPAEVETTYHRFAVPTGTALAGSSRPTRTASHQLPGGTGHPGSAVPGDHADRRGSVGHPRPVRAPTRDDLITTLCGRRRDRQNACGPSRQRQWHQLGRRSVPVRLCERDVEPEEWR